MPRVTYRPQNKFGQRFLTARELGGYAEDLKLTATAFSESYFEFLERERLLVPICRVRYPEGIVRKNEMEVYLANDEPLDIPASLPLEVDPTRVSAAKELDQRIRFWPMDTFGGSTLPRHPLDDIDPAHAEFIEQNAAEIAFHPWETFKVMVGYAHGHPVRADAVTSYYHYWQVFWLAEIQTIRISVCVNLLDEEILGKILHAKLHEIPSERQSATIPLGNRQALRTFPQHEPAFQALAYFWAYRGYLLQQASRGLQGRRPRLTGQRLDAFRMQEQAIATEAMKRWAVDSSTLLGFLKWQCQRWQDWDRRGQRYVADEYKRNISRTVYLKHVLTGMDFDHITREVGTVTGHARPTLDVIFPNWTTERKESAARSLKHWIKPSMSSMAPIGYDLSDADCGEFLEWLEREGFLQFFWHIQRLDELAGREDLIGQQGLAKEIEGLTTTIEHLLNHLGHRHWTSKSAEDMFGKVKWLWNNMKEVLHGLGTNRSLTNTRSADFQTQMTAITHVTSGGAHAEIVRDFLRMILIRNQGVHLSLRGIDHEELYQLLEVLLRSVVLVWKHAKRRGLI